jgi:hypothetical protein
MVITVHYASGVKRDIEIAMWEFKGGRFTAFDSEGRQRADEALGDLFGIYSKPGGERIAADANR